MRGILSRRIFEAEQVIGYDAHDVESGATLPLVKLKDRARGDDWDALGNPFYAFSMEDFREADRILVEAAKQISEGGTCYARRVRAGRVPGQGAASRCHQDPCALQRGAWPPSCAVLIGSTMCSSSPKAGSTGSNASRPGTPMRFVRRSSAFLARAYAEKGSTIRAQKFK